MDYRLKSNKDFTKVIKKGDRGFSNSLTLMYFKATAIKYGIAISKKHGKAVKRNRIKRLLRESLRKQVPNLNGNYYLVIIPKVKEEYSLKEFDKDLKYILNKKKLINNA